MTPSENELPGPPDSAPVSTHTDEDEALESIAEPTPESAPEPTASELHAELSAAEAAEGSSFGRKVLSVVGTVVAIALAGAVLVIYYSNTSQLEFIESLPTLDAESGTEFTAELPDDITCAPQYTTIYRKAPLGRWQQTHSRAGAGFEPDRREMWHTSTRSWDISTECNESSTVTLVLPESGISEEIAICETDERCLRVDVN